MNKLVCPFIGLFLLASCLPGVVGCAKPHQGNRLTGKVTLNGEPIKSGIISFIGSDQNPEPFPIANGKYEAFLSPGEKSVTFVAKRVVREEPRNDFPGDTEMIPIYESLIPKKYMKKNATMMTIEDKNQVRDFELTDD